MPDSPGDASSSNTPSSGLPDTPRPAPLSRPRADTERVRRRLERFARWSDDVFRIPGTSIRIGLEPLVGLIPGVGDAAGLIVSAYVPIEAWRQGAPGRLVGKMLGVIAIDALAGTVPVVGDVFDVTYRANRRNVDMLVEWLNRDLRGQYDDEQE